MSEWYVSPAGLVGNAGTINSPWDLGSALTGHTGSIQPGDTVWLISGAYTKTTTWSCTVNGTLGTGVDNQDGKIKFRNYPTHKASITTTNAGVEVLTLDCSYVWFWGTLGGGQGIEVWRNVTERTTTRGSNFWYRNSPQNGNKIIHVVTRDGGNGVLSTNGAGNAADYRNMELYGLISYNHGQDNSPRTHGIYLQHQTLSGEPLRLTGAIVFNTLGHGAQIYSEISLGLSNIEVRDSIIFNGGLLGTDTATWTNFLFGVGVPPIVDSKVINLIGHYPTATITSKIFSLGATGTDAQNVEVSGLYLVGGAETNNVSIRQFRTDGNPSLNFHDNFVTRRIPSPTRIVQIEQAGSVASGWSGWNNNTWSGRSETQTAWRQVNTDQTWATWKTNTGLGATDLVTKDDPKITRTFTIPLEKYNDGYGHICFFNWASGTSVLADISAIITMGSSYEVYNVQDIFGPPIRTGVFTGQLIELPTTGVTPPVPVGVTPRDAPRTSPFFDAFVVIQSGSSYQLFSGIQHGWVLLDFGPPLIEGYEATTIVTGQAGILPTSQIEIFSMGETTGDHSEDEHHIENLKLIGNDIMSGHMFTARGECLVGTAEGQFKVHFVWK